MATVRTCEPVFTVRFEVGRDSIDENGHVNNVEIVRWMQEAAVAHAEATGGMAATREAGATWVVRSHHVEYLRAIFEGDPVEVKTWVTTLGRSRSLRKYVFVVGDNPVARGETLWVFVEAGTGRPRKIAPDVVAAFSLVTPEEEPTLPRK
jgi:acyl-CoA thioester hydrolase